MRVGGSDCALHAWYWRRAYLQVGLVLYRSMRINNRAGNVVNAEEERDGLPIKPTRPGREKGGALRRVRHGWLVLLTRSEECPSSSIITHLGIPRVLRNGDIPSLKSQASASASLSIFYARKPRLNAARCMWWGWNSQSPRYGDVVLSVVRGSQAGKTVISLGILWLFFLRRRASAQPDRPSAILMLLAATPVQPMWYV